MRRVDRAVWALLLAAALCVAYGIAQRFVPLRPSTVVPAPARPGGGPALAPDDGRDP
jgi:hypothetical protein